MTHKASADVTGGRLVEVTGAYTVAHAGAGSTKIAGVAGFDVKANADVTVFWGGVQRCTAAGAINPGDLVAAAADGKVAANATGAFGVALQAAAKDGDVIDVRIN